MSWHGWRKLHRPSHGFWNKLNQAEALLVKTLLFGIVLLALVQAAYEQDPLEREFKVSQHLQDEVGAAGRDAEQAADADIAASTELAAGTITLRLVNYFSVTGIKVLVNGTERANFLHKDVILNVRPGDQIALDGSSFLREVQVQVLAATPGIVSPKEGSLVVIRGDVKYFEPVQGKQTTGS